MWCKLSVEQVAQHRQDRDSAYSGSGGQAPDEVYAQTDDQSFLLDADCLFQVETLAELESHLAPPEYKGLPITILESVSLYKSGTRNTIDEIAYRRKTPQWVSNTTADVLNNHALRLPEVKMLRWGASYQFQITRNGSSYVVLTDRLYLDTQEKDAAYGLYTIKSDPELVAKLTKLHKQKQDRSFSRRDYSARRTILVDHYPNLVSRISSEALEISSHVLQEDWGFTVLHFTNDSGTRSDHQVSVQAVSLAIRLKGRKFVQNRLRSQTEELRKLALRCRKERTDLINRRERHTLATGDYLVWLISRQAPVFPEYAFQSPDKKYPPADREKAREEGQRKVSGEEG